MNEQSKDADESAPKAGTTAHADTRQQHEPLKTRHSQSGQQQAQHGGATQGPGKGKADGRK
jgi:hypothetical protein